MADSDGPRAMSEATLHAWQAEAVTEDTREALFQQTVSFTALEQKMLRRWWAAGWIVGGIGSQGLQPATARAEAHARSR